MEKEIINYDLTSIQKTFLENDYLTEKYHLTKKVNEIAQLCVNELKENFQSSFVGLCLVGGLVNGSHVLRIKESKEKEYGWLSKFLGLDKTHSDVDFYLLVDGAQKEEVLEFAQTVTKYFNSIGFPSDSYLNGKNMEELFDIQKIGQYIINQEHVLLNLPFGCIFGDANEAKQKVIHAVNKLQHKYQFWSQIQMCHDMPLSIYHSSFDANLTNFVNLHWLPKKLQKFGLLNLGDLI